MTRKEILLFQLREIRNEFADALEGLTHEELLAQPMKGRNPIGWIACHCINNFNFFLYQRQINKSVLNANEEYKSFAKYGWSPPTKDNKPPDLTELASAVDRIFSDCVDLIASLEEEALTNLPPHWHHKNFESTAGNCVRVINHSNAHLRQIWITRGALGDKDHWPVQTLYKKLNEERGRFYVPDREKILEDRKR